jgi:hypothetical protein
MDFKELLTKTKEAKERASVEPSVDPRSRNASLGQIRRAKEDLLGLMADYKNEVKRRIVFILPVGEGVDKFTETSVKDFGCFAIDAEGPYKDSIANINPALFSQSIFTPAILDTVNNYFQDVADEIGLISYPMVTYKNTYTKMLNNKQDLLEVVKLAFNEQIGAELVGHYAIQKAAVMGLEEEFAGKIMPVILSTNDTKLIEALSENLKIITNNIFVVETNEKTTAKEIEKTFMNIKKTIKNVV